VTKAILTTGDAVNFNAGATPYRMVGIPDGSGHLTTATVLSRF
jgi:hypothetical protein